MPRRIVLAGGGTGGHVYPALAIGDALRARGHELLYYGDPDRLEGRVVEPRGYPLRPVRAMAWPRSGLVGKARFALSLALATLRSAAQLRRDRAEMVLGVGGYVSAPTVLGAWLLGIPRAIHEANATPGLANQLCARVSNLVLLTFASSVNRVPGKAPREVVGCPVNPRILDGDRKAARERYGLPQDIPVLLVVGGSLGAATINAIGMAAARLADRSYGVLLVTGPRYHEEVRRSLDPLPPNVVILDYENRMGDAYAASDLVVCRAGSSTLAELTVLGKPSVLVPSPNVTENHQESNARGLETAGAALVFTEADLSGPAQSQGEGNLRVGQVLDRIGRLMRDRTSLTVMAEAARSLGHLETSEKVADLLETRLLGGATRPSGPGGGSP